LLDNLLKTETYAQIVKSLVDKKTTFKKLKFKPLKTMPFNVKPIFDNSTDWDKDGVINRKDCVPLDPSRQGLMELIQGRKAKKELATVKELDLPIEEDYKKELKEKISQGEKEKEFYKKNIKESFSDFDKRFDKLSKEYVKRSDKYNPLAQLYGRNRAKTRTGRKELGYERAVYFLIPKPRKLFGNTSIPDMKPEKYESFKPNTTGNIFRPPTFVPPDLQRKRERKKQRELLRQYYRNNPEEA